MSATLASRGVPADFTGKGVPAEFRGLARVFRDRIAAEDQVSGELIDALATRITDRISERRHPIPRANTLKAVAYEWRQQAVMGCPERGSPKRTGEAYDLKEIGGSRFVSAILTSVSRPMRLSSRGEDVLGEDLRLRRGRRLQFLPVRKEF
jgi:hypothetical protein